MKKLYRAQVSLLIILCGVMPMIGMNTGQEMNFANLAKAALTLPASYNNDHLCIKHLEDTLTDFRAEQSLYRKKEATLEDAEKLINKGVVALQGIKSLTIGLINEVDRQKTLFDLSDKTQDSLKALVAQGQSVKANESAISSAQLSKNESDLNAALQRVSALANRHAQIQDELHKYQSSYATVIWQRNICGLALALSFLGYFFCRRR
jgi:hypothetical protein